MAAVFVLVMGKNVRVSVRGQNHMYSGEAPQAFSFLGVGWFSTLLIHAVIDNYLMDAHIYSALMHVSSGL